MNVLARGLETSRAFKAPSGVSLRSVSIFYRYRRSRPLKYTDKGYYIQIQAQCKAYSSHADMDITRQRLVERIHRTDTKLVLYVTGGGTHASTWLLCVPGASKSVLDVRIPYSCESLEELVPSSVRKETSYASERMAIELSKSAYRKAACLSSFGTPVMGVGITCALATDRMRRGDDKIFVSVYGPKNRLQTYSLILEKGSRSRLEEDILASDLALKAIAREMGIVDDPQELLQTCDIRSHDVIESNTHFILGNDIEKDIVSDAVERLAGGFAETVEFSGGYVYVNAPRPNRMYLPGSFNPLHEGHKKLLQAAEARYPGKEGAFELSIGNADKGMLTHEEIVHRVKQFTAQRLPVVLTKAPLFTTKSELFPGSTFVVGYDTATRLVQQRYYGSEADMIVQFAKLAQLQCNFIVAGRVERSTGRYFTLDDVEIPDILDNLANFLPLSPDEFRVDISSTEIRERSTHV